MHHAKTEAVILDTTDVFDADRSFLLFTRELGKIRARARGVRKPTSRLTGHLLAYVPTMLELAASGSNWLVTQATIQTNVSDGTYPANPMRFLKQAGIIAESLNRLYVEGESHPDVYDGLVYTLERLLVLCADDEGPAELVAAEFLLKALAELGYRPELEACVASGEAVSPDWIGWSSELGGIVSEEAAKRLPGGAKRISSAKTVVALRQFLRPLFVAERLTMPVEVGDEVVGVIYDYLQYQIGQPLKALG